MDRKRFPDDDCPIARSLSVVGDGWSLLIIRDAMGGATRFEQFRRSLGIVPGMLTRRLGMLVAEGLLERRRYQERPPRDEYHLTERGRRLHGVLFALGEWGSSEPASRERVIDLVDGCSGDRLDPVLVDRASGRPVEDFRPRLVPGPGASPALRSRMAALRTAQPG